jgi:biotin synthase
MILKEEKKAVRIGANIIMPKKTPGNYRDSYKLYENKPRSCDSADDCLVSLRKILKLKDRGYLKGWGDSKHYFIRSKRKILH